MAVVQGLFVLADYKENDCCEGQCGIVQPLNAFKSIDLEFFFVFFSVFQAEIILDADPRISTMLKLTHMRQAEGKTV